MATARQFVSIAIAENGYKESGDNLTKYGEWFGGDGDPWCAMFVSWCAAKAGIPEDIIPRTNSAGEFVYQAKYNGIGTYHAKGSGYSPQIGDLFIVGYQSGTSAQHVGIVAEDAANGTFLSIEGNASDRVLQQTRNVSENDYVTPQFDNKAGQTVQYTNFPKYTLSESAIRDIATMITGEQGGEDELACRQEASQLANLNEVYYGKDATETDILNSLHRGWYEKLSWSRGCTQTAIDAVRFVLIDGKRVLPRYVTEHDEFPNHIKNAKERNEYIKHQTQVSNYAGADYIFYCFFGTDQDKDIAGYLKSSYEKYKNDVPWSDTAEGITEEGETKITSSRVVSETGGRGEARPNPLEGQNTLGGACELYIINHDGKIMFPAVPGEITLETCRKGVPGKLSFSVLKSDELDFAEGAQVVLKSYGVGMFYGFVFEKSRSKGEQIKVTAYDQLRYFKNKDCYVYEDKTAAELVKMIAEDHNLICGELTDTQYKIPLRVEDNLTLFDIVQNALDLTILNTGNMYVLYDDFGKLTLKKCSQWLYDLVIDAETASDLDFSTSINNETYTRVKLFRDNEEGEREIYIHNDEDKINRWGVLQMCETAEDGEDGQQKAAVMSALYGQKSRTLSIKDAFGNPHIKGGCSVAVMLDVGEETINHFMLVENVKHKFAEGKHVMDLDLIGGGIYGE